MQKKSQAGYALAEFIQDVGIPTSLHTDDAKELNLGTWHKIRLKHAIKQTQTEPHSPWQNRAEGAIKELKRHVHCLMNQSKTPKHLWDYCTCYAEEIRAQPLYSLHGCTSSWSLVIHQTFQSMLSVIGISQCGILKPMNFQKITGYLGIGLELHIVLDKQCVIGFCLNQELQLLEPQSNP